ncbi:hypothetical protein M1K46_06735 [Fictibacillus sp. WQ 8-8]|uniref:DUF1797 family protein n=1 Tax=Fictibacillus marinisediminis TaxID=2878389 RepID=A0A9X1X9N5_9BACL|nr:MULTISPECIES: hypothetical protein [Fictibacillus]MCK6256564.1 hypothetical protein [Fictibacillus marinisediminis]MCQ6265356.1 hypothetical protein [Fictibacillus sp. WQ 8-8]MED2972026.1 hypothetical protein [Fictibacillus sp. B-59209]SFE03266.1 hypothetical protein SAMN05428981_103167 [Bacillus sp. OV194]
MEVKEQIMALMGNPEREFEFKQKTDLPGVKDDLVRIRYVPQGDSGFFQSTFYDEETEIVGSRVFDELEDVILFVEKNKI